MISIGVTIRAKYEDFMLLVFPHKDYPLKLRLTRDLVRVIKRGHPWVFAEALRSRPDAAAGAHAILQDKRGREIAGGIYDPHSALAFRVCTVEPAEVLNDVWAVKRMVHALSLRRTLFDDQTTGFRLFNGEGDGLPGLICDVYGEVGVIQLDGAGPSNFWHPQGVAQWIAPALSLQAVYLKSQSRQGDNNQALVGDTPNAPIQFLENGVRFTVDVIRGQKTGFFVDQRQNRQQVRTIADGRRVLNLFGYTGGFSVYAGLGGASHVTTVDIAKPALEVAHQHWQLNNLPVANHETVQADAFEFLERATQAKKVWDLVITDPPSFASSNETVKKAIAAYQKLIAGAATVTAPNGFLAAGSCSSHIDLPTFLTACETGISRARRRATLISVNSQPPDHPTPLPFSEFRYLKFVVMRIE